MAAPNVVLMPDNLDLELGDLRRKIRAIETQAPTAQPYGWQESVDAGHPMQLWLPISSGLKYSIAKLSLKMLPYRTNSSFAGGNTGGSSQNHVHAAAAHAHRIFQFASGTPMGATAHKFWTWVADQTQALLDVLTPSNVDLYSENTTPGNDGLNSVDHTHAVGGSSLGVSEGSTSTVTAIGVDGVDKTSALGGGPWGDTVDLDISSVLPTGDGIFHYVQLTTAGQGRVQAWLKLA